MTSTGCSEFQRKNTILYGIIGNSFSEEDNIEGEMKALAGRVWQKDRFQTNRGMRKVHGYLIALWWVWTTEEVVAVGFRRKLD